MTPQGSFKVSDRQRWKCLWIVRTICMRWHVQNFVGRYFYERTLFEADDQCQKHQLGLNYRSGWKKLGPLKSGTDRKFSDLPNGLRVEPATAMGHIHLRGKWRPRTPRWYNAALTHTKWMGNPSSPTLSSNCENLRACFCQTSPGMHVWGVLVPIRTVFVRSNRPRGENRGKTFAGVPNCHGCQGERR